MSKSIKFQDDTFLDSTGIVHNKKLLSEILKYITSDISRTDLNSYTKDFVAGYGHNLTNTPSETLNLGHLISIPRHDVEGYVTQYFSPYTTNDLYMRKCEEGTWGEWIQITNSSTKRQWVYQLPVVTSVSANSWQQIATNLTTDKLPAGKYVALFSASINGHSSGISTLNPYMDGARLDTHTRSSIPLNNALQTSGICTAYLEFTTETTHTVNIHNYSNVAVGPKYAQVRFIRID